MFSTLLVVSDDEVDAIQLKGCFPGPDRVGELGRGRLDVGASRCQSQGGLPTLAAGLDAQEGFAEIGTSHLEQIISPRRLDLALPLLEPERWNRLHENCSP